MAKTPEQVNDLVQMAKENGGHCTTCGKALNIYRYTINRTLVTFLRAAAGAVQSSGNNDFDASTLGLAYSVRTQSSKLRQHGLIARVKGKDGAQLPSRWLITRKGWDFLRGEPVPAKVLVFENQVIGHDGGDITIMQVMGEANVADSTPITPTESKVYRSMREPRRNPQHQAKYRGSTRGDRRLINGEMYSIEIEKLQVGRPVKLLAPLELNYPDIAAFQREWLIQK